MTCVTSKLIFSTSLEGQELFLVKKPIFQYNIFLKRGSDHYTPALEHRPRHLSAATLPVKPVAPGMAAFLGFVQF